jgi:LAO/AO transport system kinase
MDHKSLVEGLLSRNKRITARLITMLENRDGRAFDVVAECFGKTGGAIVIGVTGPPGAGKSTLTDKLVKELRQGGKRVGIIAVDPTSPYSGGAILGDRVRMSDLATDDGVFIRSIATRGALGGISKAVYGAIKVLDIYGMDYIFVETVGVGQSEVDIVRVADLVIVTMVPGLGDDIQGIKAGIMEIADLFVVNKADREGADRTFTHIKAVLDMNPDKDSRKPDVIMAVAVEGGGVPDILAAAGEFIEYAKSSGRWEEKKRSAARHEILSTAGEFFLDHINRLNAQSNVTDELVDKVIGKGIDPYSAAKELTESFRT